MDRSSQAAAVPAPHDRAIDKRVLFWRILIVAAIGLGIAVRVWAATQWSANFQSDEAVFGLMARHILAGGFTATLYGPAYLGSIESILAAGLMSVLGPSVMPFRMSALLLFAAFFILHSILTSRYFGHPVALVSLLFLALPGFHVLEWTYQPIGAYGAMFAIGTLMLLVGLSSPSNPGSKLLRAAAMGALAGLGLWANNTMILYLAAVGIIAFLSSPEWSEIYARLASYSEKLLMIPLPEVLPIASIAVGITAVLAFFSGACRPEGLYATLGSIARIVLFMIGVGAVASAFVLSRRRRPLAFGAGALGLGFVTGYSPLIYQWIVKQIPPYWAVYPSCLEGSASRAKLLVKEILPALWGIPTYEGLTRLSGASLIAWLAVIGLAIAAIALVLWWNRTTVWRILAWAPLDERARPAGMIVLLLILPLGISLLAANTVDLYSIRHMLVAVQASAIVFAVFLVRLSGRLRRTGWIVAIGWLALVGVSNISYASANWLVKFTRYEPTKVLELKRYLEARDVKYAYADYWGAFTLDYVLEEQVIVAPYNGIDRYPDYTTAAALAPMQAFIFPISNAPTPTGKMEDLMAFLNDRDNPRGEGRASSLIRSRLSSQVVVEMHAIEDWSVWVVADASLPWNLGSVTGAVPEVANGL